MSSTGPNSVLVNYGSIGTTGPINAYDAAYFVVAGNPYVGVIDYSGNPGATGYLQIFNVANPQTPTFVSLLAVAYNLQPQSIVTDGTAHLYITGRNHTLVVVDVTTPATPSVVNSLTISTGQSSYYQSSYAVIGGNQYVFTSGNSTAGFIVVDVTTPTAPSLVYTGSAGKGAGCCVFQNDYLAITLYTTSGVTGYFQIYNVSNPASPSLVSQLAIPSISSTNAEPIACVVSDDGNTCFVFDAANSPSWMNVIDVSNVSSPSIVQNVTLPVAAGSGRNACTRGTMLYVANNSHIYAYDFSTNSVTTLISSVASYTYRNLLIKRNFIYCPIIDSTSPNYGGLDVYCSYIV